jgi:hypothetical protein
MKIMTDKASMNRRLGWRFGKIQSNKNVIISIAAIAA